MADLLEFHFVSAKELLDLEDGVASGEPLLKDQLLGQLSNHMRLRLTFPVEEVGLDDLLALETNLQGFLQDATRAAAELHTAISPLIAGAWL